MDSVRGLEDRIDVDREDMLDDAAGETPVDIGGDERRMHVRAYNYWVSLLGGRAYPLIEDLNPESIADFGAHSVLIDFTDGLDDPRIQFLGRALREECGVESAIDRIAQVPSRSLLSRLTDHYLQIIANRAPIGFEAEFVSQRGHNTLYRGILMPFSSDGDAIDFIYGVINWKEVLDTTAESELHKAIDAARDVGPRPPLTAPVWADGPFAGMDDAVSAQADGEAESLPATPLSDQLMLARETAAAARAADTRSRAALYRALGRAYDFALAAESDAESYQQLLEAAGIAAQARAPMTPIVKLVFGADYDKARVTEFAAALSYARRTGVPAGRLTDTIDGFPGGMKAMVKAERDTRRPEARPATDPMAKLRARPAIAQVQLAPKSDAEFVLLIARANGAGALDIVAQVDADDQLTRQAVRHIAA